MKFLSRLKRPNQRNKSVVLFFHICNNILRNKTASIRYYWRDGRAVTTFKPCVTTSRMASSAPMKKPPATSIALFLTTLLLGACSGGMSTPKDDKKNPPGNSTSEDTPLVNCNEILFDVDELSSMGIELPITHKGLLIQADSALYSCESTTTENGSTTIEKRKGYKTLEVAKLYTSGKLSDNSSSYSIIFEMDRPKIDSNDYKNLATLFELSESVLETALNKKDLAYDPYFNWVILAKAEGIETAMSSVIDENTSRLSFRTAFDSNLLNQLQQGGSITMAAFPSGNYAELNPPSEAFLYTLSSESIELNERTSYVSLLKTMWNEHSYMDSDKAKTLSWADIFAAWKSVSSEDFLGTHAELAPIFEYAKNLMRDLNNAKSIHEVALLLLGKLDQLNTKEQFIHTYYLDIAHAVSIQTGEAIQKAYDWHNSAPSTDNKRNYIIYVAKELNTSRWSNPWDFAQEFVNLVGYNQKDLELFQQVHVRTALLLGRSISKPEVEKEALNLFLDPLFSKENYAAFKEVATWLTEYSGPNMKDNEAFYAAKKIVFNENWSAEKFELVKKTFAWVSSYSGANLNRKLALTETVHLTDRPNWSHENLAFFKSTHSWLSDYSGPYMSNKKEAFNKTKDYTSREGFDSDKLTLAKNSFRWLSDYSGPYISNKKEALKKNEAYLFVEMMTPS